MGLSFPSARENMSAQLIGSRISLISQNDVRYEGFLHSLDPEKREVVLQNVRCFGTEDRKEGEGKVEPVEEPYSFIYFQESQIKDLSVIENPRPEEFMMGMPGHDMNYPPYGYPMQNSFMMGNQFGYPSYPYSPYGFGGYGYDPMMGQMGGMPGYDFGYPNYPMGPGGPMAPPNLNPENADQQQPASASQQKAAPSEGNASDAQKKDSQPQQAAATEAGSAQSEKQAQQPSQAPKNNNGARRRRTRIPKTVPAPMLRHSKSKLKTRPPLKRLPRRLIPAQENLVRLLAVMTSLDQTVVAAATETVEAEDVATTISPNRKERLLLKRLKETLISNLLWLSSTRRSLLLICLATLRKMVKVNYPLSLLATNNLLSSTRFLVRLRIGKETALLITVPT